MDMGKKKLHKMVNSIIVGQSAELSQSEIRRCIYLKSVLCKPKNLIVLADPERAMQSDRVSVLVGSTEKPFQVPQDLLTQCSSVFNKMCTLPFKESNEQVIKLPEEKPQ